VVLLVLVLPQLQQSQRFQEALVRPGNLALRASYWQLALPIATSTPGTTLRGIGIEATVVPQFGGSVPARLGAAPALILNGTHNQYVLTFLEQGLIGLGLLVAWSVATLLTGLRALREPRDPHLAALIGATASCALVMLANNAMLHAPSFTFFALA